MTDPKETIEVQDWYSPGLPKKELKPLMRRSNRHALIYFGLWFALLGGLGWYASRLYLAGSWWALPVFFLYGTVYTGNNPRWHEASHGTPFKTVWLNNFFYFLCGAMEFRDTVDFRWSHARHHSYTKFRPVDPEIADREKPDLLNMVLDFFYIRMGLSAIKNLFLHAVGLAAEDVRAYVPDDQLPKMYWSARGVLLLHAAVLVLAVYLESWLPVLLFGLPRFYGAWLMWIFIWLQHVGMEENVWDHRRSTRSFRVNFFYSFLFMNMENHVEHHLYPLVPFHKLPALREKIEDSMPPPYRGLLRPSLELIPVLFRRRKDPAAFVERPVPE
ncbi:MAG: fatty acid desaturase [Spirochaetales bacterium]|nr:fatty acid desaturase [Spirochaetales bacterium]MCF7939600.1 fatty acid desaturase [Spirochaetales bacterium]